MRRQRHHQAPGAYLTNYCLIMGEAFSSEDTRHRYYHALPSLHWPWTGGIRPCIEGQSEPTTSQRGDEHQGLSDLSDKSDYDDDSDAENDPQPDDDPSNCSDADDHMISDKTAEHADSGYNSDGTDVSIKERSSQLEQQKYDISAPDEFGEAR